MKRGRKKKAISPLIATVILVGFAVALGAIVSTYVIKQAKEFDPGSFIEDSPYCDNVVVEVLTDPDNPPCACLPGTTAGPNSVYLLQHIGLKNKGSFGIPRMSISAPGQESQIYLYRDPDTDQVTPLPAGEKFLNFGIAFIPSAIENNALIKIQPHVRDIEKSLEALERGEQAVIIPCSRQEVSFNIEEVCPGGICNCSPLACPTP